MHTDPTNQYRPLLEDDPPAFLDRINTPWDHVPDLEEYNRHAYKRVVRALKELSRTRAGEGQSNAQGMLVLGEAGTGKTHLLMRVARNLSDSNHVLFVRKPNNEDAVAQHVWANVVSSLTRSLPDSPCRRSRRSCSDRLSVEQNVRRARSCSAFTAKKSTVPSTLLRRATRPMSGPS
jgi:hypothetical protein